MAATNGVVVGVKIEGLEKLQGKLRSKHAAVPAKRFLDRAGLIIQRNVKPLVPVNVGTLRRSIDYEVASDTPVPTKVKVGTNVKYAPYVEFGRPAGKPWPPSKPIEYWVRRKFKTGPEADIYPLVRAVRKNIAERGIEEKPFLRNGTLQSKAELQAIVPVLAKELEEAYRNATS